MQKSVSNRWRSVLLLTVTRWKDWAISKSENWLETDSVVVILNQVLFWPYVSLETKRVKLIWQKWSPVTIICFLWLASTRYFIAVTLTNPKVCKFIFSEILKSVINHGHGPYKQTLLFSHVSAAVCRTIRPLLTLNGTSYTISWRRSTNLALKWCYQSCPLEMWPHNTLQTEICSVRAVLWRKILRELWWYDDILCLCCRLALAVYQYFHDSIAVCY